MFKNYRTDPIAMYEKSPSVL